MSPAPPPPSSDPLVPEKQSPSKQMRTHVRFSVTLARMTNHGNRRPAKWREERRENIIKGLAIIIYETVQVDN